MILYILYEPINGNEVKGQKRHFPKVNPGTNVIKLSVIYGFL